MRDAFLAERDAHCVCDAGFARDARLRRVCGTHRITYHSKAASLITCLQNNLICGIKVKGAAYGLVLTDDGNKWWGGRMEQPKVAICPKCGEVSIYLENVEKLKNT